MRVSQLIALPTLVLVSACTASLPSAASSAPAPGPGDAGSGWGGLRSPFAVAVTGDRVYVADFDDDRIRVFTRGGEPVLGWGGSGAAPGQFRGPAGIAIGADGSVYVTDLYNGRVQKFGPDGASLAAWPAGGDDAAPFGIAVDRWNRVYVSDLGAGQVRSWSADGAPLGVWGSPGHGAGELDQPWGVAVGARGEVFVADHGNHRVARFSSEGSWLGAWGEAGQGEGLLFGPMSVAIARDGSLCVSDLVGGRVQRITPGGELAALWPGPGAGESGGSPTPGVALDDAGALYVADPGRHQIARVHVSIGAPTTAAPVAFALASISSSLGRGPVTLHLAIPSAGMVGAEVFSLDGRRIHVEPPASCEAGERQIHWDTRADDGRPAPAGVYFVRVQFEDGVRRITRSGRIVVLR